MEHLPNEENGGMVMDEQVFIDRMKNQIKQLGQERSLDIIKNIYPLEYRQKLYRYAGKAIHQMEGALDYPVIK